MSCVFGVGLVGLWGLYRGGLGGVFGVYLTGMLIAFSLDRTASEKRIYLNVDKMST